MSRFFNSFEIIALMEFFSVEFLSENSTNQSAGMAKFDNHLISAACLLVSFIMITCSIQSFIHLSL